MTSWELQLLPMRNGMMVAALLLLAPAPGTSFAPISTNTGVKTPLSSSSSSSSLQPFKNTKNISLRSFELFVQPQNQNEDSAATSTAKKNNTKNKEVINSKNPLELASWYAVEAFGKAFGAGKQNEKASTSVGIIDLTKPPSSLDETLSRIKLDNDRSYFLSGEVDRLIYDEDCVFADPFVSFNGRDRFIENLSNLGSFITNYDAKMLKYDVEKDGKEIVTKVMVKLELNLPWKPVLAWPWGVTYLIEPESNLVTSHVESWDIEPLEGVLQIFRKPTVKIRSNKD